MICRKGGKIAASFVLMTACVGSKRVIHGEWQAYGIKTDDGILSYDDVKPLDSVVYKKR